MSSNWLYYNNSGASGNVLRYTVTINFNAFISLGNGVVICIRFGIIKFRISASYYYLNKQEAEQVLKLHSLAQ
jgi:hypothetical protein